MSSRAFSLLDLAVTLCVAALLIFLMDEALSGNSRLSAAQRADAKNGAVQIAAAVSAYKMEYGIWPLTNAAVQNVEGPFLLALTGTNVQGLNPRQITFLDVVAARKCRSGFTNGMFVDSWGSPYQILVDADYDGVIPKAGSLSAQDSQVRVGVAVWNDPTTHRDEPNAETVSRRAVTSWDSSAISRLPRKDESDRRERLPEGNEGN